MSLKVEKEIISDPDAISNHIVSYYQTLYSSSGSVTGTSELCSLIPSLVTAEDNECLVSIPSEEEIAKAVFSMDPSSAPGPDGFSGYFYQVCWDIIKDDVVRFVLQFFTTGSIYQNVNSSFIALIPKVEGASSITQFRPIAMANLNFQIITKILVDRLGSIANRVISTHQAAFIKGRRISDCIEMLSETMNILDKKAYGGNVAIKLDIVKAFETLVWNGASFFMLFNLLASILSLSSGVRQSKGIPFPLCFSVLQKMCSAEALPV